MCERQELLVGYLYDELGADERREFEAHLTACADCRAELAGLRSTREHLSLWAPPEPDLGFRVIRGGSAPAPALPRRRSFAPAFAFAAAAVIVLAVAAAIANIEVRYGNEGMTIRTGWADDPARDLAAASNAPAARDDARQTAAVEEPGPATGAEFAALNRRLDEIEAALASQPAGATPASAPGARSDAEMLRRVRQIVGEAESRQRVAFAQLLMQAVNDFERQRRLDLAALQQDIGNSKALTNAEMAQTRDIVHQLMRVATRQEK